MKPRRHQSEFQDVVRRIRDGEPITKILGLITPGGGKSSWPQIAAQALIPAKVDKIAWVVPRLSLAEQGAKNFLHPADRARWGHQLEIRQSTNDYDPSRGHAGFVTTYQAIGIGGPGSLADEFRRYRYALIHDEPHHVERGEVWHTALQPLVDLAKLNIFMTGTEERGDRKPIAFFDYREVGDGRLLIDRMASELHVISYGRADAIHEHAIIPVEFRFHPSRGPIKGIDSKGNPFDEILQDAEFKEVSKILGAALDTEYAYELLAECVEDWKAYRAKQPWSKLLVITRSIEAAKKVKTDLRSMGVEAGYATSEESALAQDEIKRFKQSSHALITVAMAYEGLDVPAITHTACLTHYRSGPWIEQAVARGVRCFDAPGAPPWKAQRALFYAPDEALMRSIWERIKEDQERGAREPEENGGGGGGRPGFSIGIDGHADASRAESDDYVYDQELTGQLVTVARQHGLAGADAVAGIARDLGFDLDQLRGGSHGPKADTSAGPTANEREKAKKAWIEQRCRSLDADLVKHDGPVAWGTHNKLIFAQFRKPRQKMTEAELDQVMAWMEKTWPSPA